MRAGINWGKRPIATGVTPIHAFSAAPTAAMCTVVHERYLWRVIFSIYTRRSTSTSVGREMLQRKQLQMGSRLSGVVDTILYMPGTWKRMTTFSGTASQSTRAFPRKKNRKHCMLKRGSSFEPSQFAVLIAVLSRVGASEIGV